MSKKQPIAISVLDLAPIPQGSTASTAFHHSLELARYAEQWGYKRYWLAEHHNMTGIASAATSVLIGYIAAGTESIRVGAGGIMLPNHSPLVIAEQFGTLESLYPGRIDLGLGRAPGTNQKTMQALRRNAVNDVDSFPYDVKELQSYFADAKPEQEILAVPGQGLHVPIWLLGSSLYSAQLSASLGLPFAFASHFASDMLLQALALYRSNFRPSAALAEPYAIACINVIAADTDAEAKFMFTSQQQQFLNLRRGNPGMLPPPVEDINALWSPSERMSIEQTLRFSAVGSPETVKQRMQSLLAETGVNEIMVNGQIYNQQDRLRSFAIVASFKDSLYQ